MAATVHRGELSPMAKATMTWSTVGSRGVRRGLPISPAGDHRD